MGVEISAHSWGLCETNWAARWLQTRKDLGQNAEGDKLLMCSVGPGGQFLPGKQMPTDELAIHLREIRINLGIPIEEAKLYTSHSMKATMLSWCAKAGVPPNARRMLGYHSKASDKSTLVYSRDVMAWPLRHLGKVMKFVQRGLFDPDCTRSGRWVGREDEAACDAFSLSHATLAEAVINSDPNR